MKAYKQLNLITGWVVFIIAAITYLLTIEPTASFWDCGEFITTSYKLEVGHPPGAPFFMILGRFFTLFGDSSQAGLLMNALSALASAFTILFLFWTITHLTKKMVCPSGEMSLGEMIAILGSGVVGSLAYTFSDTFWFSAVEAEVYATSSLFTAIVFWAILRWEDEADQPQANRWLIFIAYMIGLSIGVHLLNLLAIPAIGLVYYFKKYQPTLKGAIISFLVSLVVLAIVMYGIIPGVITIASWFELVFTNGLGLPFNTGVFLYAVLLIGGLVYGIYYTYVHQKELLNIILTSVAVILLGYSSFAMIVIRSSADTPMDQNSPDNVFSLLTYLNREQYGDRPLFFGQYYNAPLDSKERYSFSKNYYVQQNGRYEVAQEQSKPNYNPHMCTIFPRMYSSQPNHIEAYKEWGGIEGTPIMTTNDSGEQVRLIKPTFSENLTYFFRYQVVHMYWRYFMWNFAGRQNDIQGHGDVLNGNWISGIPFIDNIRLGDQTQLPAKYAENKGRNRYFMLPFILGLIGLFYQYNKKNTDFWVVMTLFIMTGLAIVVYLNQYPQQPRERDYSFAASFYAFSIWIGLGVAAISEAIGNSKHSPLIASIVSVAALILVPGIMLAENKDDHDRSNRYTCTDFGANYLHTCAPNGIIFTNGDNDTFPLWYNQEVEGVRTDLRVCNLSYLQTDWYIDQMRRKAYESDALPINFEHDQYVQGNRDVVYLMNRINQAIDLKTALNLIRSEDPRTMMPEYDNVRYLPTKKFYIEVDKEAVIRNKVVPEDMYDQIVDTIFIDYSSEAYITKDQLMVLDMIVNANWSRPFYFSSTVPHEKYYGLSQYFMLEGLAYRLVPIAGSNGRMDIGSVNTDLIYENMMTKFKWGNMEDSTVYVDENNRRMMTNLRSAFNRLADNLIVEQKLDSAYQVLERGLSLMPKSQLPHSYFSIQMVEEYYKIAQDSLKIPSEKDDVVKQKSLTQAQFLANDIFNDFESDLQFFISLDDMKFLSVKNEAERTLYFMQELVKTCYNAGDTDTGNLLMSRFDYYYKMFAQ
ncbi:MAG: protein O-mannosyl-transferase family [Mangrovibacterium sp.]